MSAFCQNNRPSLFHIALTWYILHVLQDLFLCNASHFEGCEVRLQKPGESDHYMLGFKKSHQSAEVVTVPRALVAKTTD